MTAMAPEASFSQEPTPSTTPSLANVRSWRNLFKKVDDSKLTFHAQIKESNSKVVKLPSEALEEGAKQWENCLVGWFIGESPDFRLVVAAVNRMWGKRSGVSVAKKGNLFVLKFSDLKLMQWVLENGPWFIGRKLFVVQCWSPDLSAGNINLKSIPLWFVLRNIPMHLYNNTCLSYIASAIGRPLYMDKGTTNQTHLDFARVCIEVNSDDELPDAISVEVEGGRSIEIRVVLPWAPERCSSCKVFGHDCLKKSEPTSISLNNGNAAMQAVADSSNNQVTEQEALTTPHALPHCNTDGEQVLLSQETSKGQLPADMGISSSIDDPASSTKHKGKQTSELPDETLSLSDSSTDEDPFKLKKTEDNKLCEKNKPVSQVELEEDDEHPLISYKKKKSRKKGKGTSSLSSKN